MPQQPIIHFTQAVREGERALCFLYGESGSGKTNSALLIARGLVGPEGKIFGIDTENRRMKVFADDADIGGFVHGELSPPFTPERFADSIEAAAAAGADCIVIDSMSHEWNDVGGVIELAAYEEEKRDRKGLLKWQQPKTRHKRFVQRLLRVDCHIIGCMRAREKFKEEIVKRGGEEKKTLVSAGYFPEQDQRLKFEATIQLRLSHERPGFPIVEKVPRGLLPAFPADKPITVETGASVRRWVGSAVAVDVELRELKRRAEEAANGGMRTLATFWNGLPEESQKRLDPHKENYRSIAREADEQAKRAKSGSKAPADVAGAL